MGTLLKALLKSNLFKDKASSRVGSVLQKEASTGAGVTLVLERSARFLTTLTHVHIWQDPVQKREMECLYM